MAKKRKTVQKEIAPGLVSEVLDHARASEQREKRYRHAQQVALSVARLREQHRKRSAEAGLEHYLREIAKDSDVDLGVVLGWFGLKEISINASGQALARLGRDIGMTVQQVLLGLDPRCRPVMAQSLMAGGPAGEASAQILPATMRRWEVIKKEIEDEYEKAPV